MSSIQGMRGLSGKARKSYIAHEAFHTDLYAYKTEVVNFQTIGTLSAVVGATSSTCPRGRFLYETGRKLYPNANPGITSYMVSVFDPISMLTGFIDPNSKVFSPMNTDRPVGIQTVRNFSINPTNQESDQGPGVFTLSKSYFGSTVDISGAVLMADDVEIKGNLTVRGNVTQIDLNDMLSEQLSVTNNGAGPAVVVNQLGASDVMNIQQNGSSSLIVKDGGNVGIGLTNPAYKLHVNGSINGYPIYQNGFLLVPTGSIISYIATAAPGGWLLCDGSAISRSTYSALFALIGTTYGAGDTISTFNLPDMRGRVPVGYGTGAGLTPRGLGSTGGAETHVLSVTELPQHTHSGSTSEDGSHTHTHNANNDYPGACLAYRDGFNTRTAADNGQQNELNLDASAALVINSNGSHTHTFTTNGGTGGGAAHNNMQPFVVVNYIIKV
jgi:microcystin-dependent protein